CSCCCSVYVASVVARRVRVVAARLALDSLAVVFLVWRTLASPSKCPCLVDYPSVVGVCAVVVVCLDLCVCALCSGRRAEQTEVHRLVTLCSGGGFPELFVVVLSGALVVLVEDRPLSLLVEVLPRSALCLFRATVVLPLWFVLCAVWLGYVLVRFSQDGSWRFWWRFSPKLPGVVLVVATLSLCRDELLLLPVGLSVLQSAWALSVKVSCPWLCVWLLHWPACLVSRFQVSWLRWWDCVSPWLG
ncbi:hypothetical protein Taro_049258, partial [Colocasia esculenta]|nr:hypothetical protein [Colocasia esculenta]